MLHAKAILDMWNSEPGCRQGAWVALLSDRSRSIQQSRGVSSPHKGCSLMLHDPALMPSTLSVRDSPTSSKAGKHNSQSWMQHQTVIQSLNSKMGSR